MKNVSKFWTRRCTSLKLMVVYCFRQILDPADIIVPAMMFCDDIKSHIIRHF
jgi:TPP-dependent trihydroxycyclohexane-1,2-dione (THcHDO) dehydratase